MDNHPSNVLSGSKNTSYPHLVDFLHFNYNHFGWSVHLDYVDTFNCFTNLCFFLCLAIFDLPFVSCHMMDYCLTANNFVHVYFVWLVFQVVPHWQVCLSLHIALLVLSTSNHSFRALPFCRGYNFYVKVTFFCQLAFIMTFLTNYSMLISIITIHVSFPSFLLLIMPHLNFHCLTVVEIIYSHEH